MMDIREHGGIFGSGQTTPLKTKIVKGMYRMPFGASSDGSASVTHFTVTKSYFWFVWSDTKILVRVNKKNLSDVLFYKTTSSISSGYAISSIIPLYELDKVIFTYSSSSPFLIMNADMSVEYSTTSFHTVTINYLIGYRYVDATKKLYLVTCDVNDYCLWSIDLTNTKSPTVTSKILFTLASSYSYAYCFFDIDNMTVRVLNTTNSGTKVNRIYNLVDFSLLTSYDNILTALSPVSDTSFKVTKDHGAYIRIDNNGLSKTNINTNAVIASKTSSAIMTELSGFLKFSHVINTLVTTVLWILPNGNFIGFFNASLVNGLSYNLRERMIFEIDENLNVIRVEPIFSTANFIGVNNFRDLRSQEMYLSSLGTSSPDFYLLK